MKDVIVIPADPRYKLAIDARPLILNEMKAECIGEFTVSIDIPCTECDYDINCAVCGGDGEYDHTVDIPWTTVKDIYKKMVASAVRNK